MKLDFKRCFTGHALAHSLSGLGIGILLVHYVPSLNSALYGLVVLVVGVLWDAMAK